MTISTAELKGRIEAGTFVGWRGENARSALSVLIARIEKAEAELNRADIECVGAMRRCDELWHDRRQLRDAWNAHMDACPKKPPLPFPSWEALAEWANASSDTPSAAPSQDSEQ